MPKLNVHSCNLVVKDDTSDEATATSENAPAVSEASNT
jgi:hypothetical protein